MLKTAIVQITINRGYDDAYRILQEPANFRLWSPILDARFEARGNNGLDWLTDLPSGPSILRFSAVNDFGVLDYTVIPEGGGASRTSAMRLLRNDDASELITVFFQQPGQSDDAFASYVDWARNDLMALKTVVETL